jgi:hypothetical protein
MTAAFYCSVTRCVHLIQLSTSLVSSPFFIAYHPPPQFSVELFSTRGLNNGKSIVDVIFQLCMDRLIPPVILARLEITCEACLLLDKKLIWFNFISQSAFRSQLAICLKTLNYRSHHHVTLLYKRTERT